MGEGVKKGDTRTAMGSEPQGEKGGVKVSHVMERCRGLGDGISYPRLGLANWEIFSLGSGVRAFWLPSGFRAQKKAGVFVPRWDRRIFPLPSVKSKRIQSGADVRST